jgi:anti-sigma factor RsiW
MTCRDMKELIHGHLDGDLTEEQETLLSGHLQSCPDCKQHLRELEKSMAFIQSLSHTYAPEGFTERVMAALPPEKLKKRKIDWKKGLLKYPFLVAASLFILLMTGSMFTAWTEGQDQFQVSAPHKQYLIIDEANNTVIVPKGQKVEGNIEVRNGTINVEGEVTGNVVVINGDIVRASTAHISGEVEEIHAILHWIWYNTKKIVSFFISNL